MSAGELLGRVDGEVVGDAVITDGGAALGAVAAVEDVEVHAAGEAAEVAVSMSRKMPARRVMLLRMRVWGRPLVVASWRM